MSFKPTRMLDKYGWNAQTTFSKKGLEQVWVCPSTHGYPYATVLDRRIVKKGASC